MTNAGALVIQAGRAGIAVAVGGVSTGAAGAATVILATGAAVALAGVGIWVLRDSLPWGDADTDRSIPTTHSS